MMGRRLLVVFLGLVMTSSIAFAQSHVENPGRKPGVRPAVPGIEKLEVPMTAPNKPLPSGYRGYTDENLDEFNRNMKEQQWGREETAWPRACELNTSEAYQRYLAMYPYGPHAPEASVRLVRATVNETLANAHTDLPNIERIEEDNNSPETIFVVKNNTGYTLSVFCSGIEDKSVTIAPDKKAYIKLDNGPYKLAASVPPSHIRPFAGQTSFEGGVYEIGFWVVTRQSPY